MVVLLAAAPTWTQLRATVTALAAGVGASLVAAMLPGVASLEGSAVDRQLDGAVMLVVLAGIMLVTALVSASIAGLEARGRVRLGTLRHARRLAVAAVAVGALCACGLVAGGLRERGDASPKASANPARLASVTSRRYEYWRVGATAFERDPVRGVGAAGFRVVWLMDRQVTGGALEAHSLVVEAAAELGIPGLLLLFMFLGGIAMAARRALRQDAELAAGGCAACSVWLLHATIDWDWQLPAVTLPALVLAGGLLALSESQPPAGGWAGARAGAGPRAGSRGLGGLGRTPRRRPAASGERAAVTCAPGAASRPPTGRARRTRYARDPPDRVVRRPGPQRADRKRAAADRRRAERRRLEALARRFSPRRAPRPRHRVARRERKLPPAARQPRRAPDG